MAQAPSDRDDTVTRLMRICCIADLHGRIRPDIAECDLLLVAGDIGPDYGAGPFPQGPFAQWLTRQRGA